MKSHLRLIRNLLALAPLTVFALASGCVPMDLDAESDAALAALGFDPNQCLSATASLVALSGTSVDMHGNGTVQGTVVLMAGSTLRLTGNASVRDNVVAGSSAAISMSGNASIGHFVQRDL